jgi:hypothetical protein
VFHTRWRRRRPPELAVEARRQRRQSRVASEIERRREESEGGWAGSGDRPRPEPGRLSRAQVGLFGPVGQLGQIGFGQLFKQNLEIQI